MGRPEPRLIVDRESEAEVFVSMLRFETSRRVMAVHDKHGRGKTDLLRKLRYQCEWVVNPPIPVALFDFEKRGVTSVIDILDRLAEHLAEAEPPVHLTNFQQLSNARALGDTWAFAQAWGSVQGAIDLTGAHLSGEAQAAGVINNIRVQHVENIAFPAWTDKMEQLATRLCREAFFTDLFAVAADRPVAILFDTVDAADTDVRRWLLNDMLRRRLLSGWEQHRLLVIIAGTDVDELLSPLAPQQRECIEPAPTLKEWEEEHVRQFLAVHECDGLDDGQVKLVKEAIAEGLSLVKAIQFAQMWKDQ